MIRIRLIGYKITFFLGMFLPIAAYSQEPMGARALGMGHATLAMPDPEWGVFVNPAMTGESRSGGFFVRQHYMLPELTDAAAFAHIPFRKFTIGAGMYRFGDDRFSETAMRIAVANTWQNLTAGIAVHYQHIQFGGNYGSGGAVGIHAGLNAKITDHVRLGARATNLNRPGYDFRNSREDLPRELGIGVSVVPWEEGLLALDLVKDVRFPASVRLGMETPLADRVLIRGGFTTYPVTLSAGFGYRTDRWQVNVAVQRHEVLGVSPGVDIVIRYSLVVNR